MARRVSLNVFHETTRAVAPLPASAELTHHTERESHPGNFTTPGSRAMGFAIYAPILMTLMTASTAPSPLYVIYQKQWSFSDAILTIIFAAYPLALLSALLLAGHLSDVLGRRPIIRLALLLEIAAMILFLTASNYILMICARSLQGIATGLGTVALGAALIDLGRQQGSLLNTVAPMAGMAIGAIFSTAAIYVTPDPSHFVFVTLAGLFLAQLSITWVAPETVASTGSAAKRGYRVLRGVPDAAKADLWAIAPLNIATWAISAFYLSIVPGLVLEITGVGSQWLGGLGICALTFGACIAVLILRTAPTRSMLLVGAMCLAVGMLCLLVAMNTRILWVFVPSSLVLGMGVGLNSLAAIRRLTRHGDRENRAGVLSWFYVQSYLAHALPTMLVGLMASLVDRVAVSNVYGAALLLLILFGSSRVLMSYRTLT